MQTSTLRILFLFAFIILSWGLSWPVSKLGLQYVGPFWYTAIRLILGTFTMMVFVMTTNNFVIPERRDIPLIIIIGVLQISVYILLANIGLAYLPAGRSSLLAYTTPLWVIPIAIIFFREETHLLRWLGFLLGVGGLLILLSPWELDWHNKDVIFGSCMLLLASFCWAISILCTRYMRWHKTALQLVPWQLLVGTIPVVCFAYFREPLAIQWDQNLILSLLYTGAFVTGLSYWSGIVINKTLPAIVVSLGFLLVPVFSLMISAFFMQETINLTTSIAILFIFFGLIFVAV